MNSQNPFYHRGPIRDRESFFGRKQEIAYLFDLVREGQSISMTGPRRFGKTSLLFYVSDPEVSRQYGLDPTQVRWGYLEGGMLDGLGEEWLYGAINRVLGNEAEAIPYTELISTLRGMVTQGLRLVLIFDEFELFAGNPLFQSRVFNRLRGLAMQFAVQFIVASKDPLAKLSFANREVLGSPFFNIFAPISLSLFQRDDALELLATLSLRGGQPFHDETSAFLFDLVGSHPLFLQIAGYKAYKLQQDGLLSGEMRGMLREEILSDLEGHLNYYWASLSPEEKYALASRPLMAQDSLSSVWDRLSETGLLYQNDYLGVVVSDFVSRQAIDGLIRCGSITMDDKRRLLAVGTVPVHLTKTEFATLKFFLQNPNQLLTAEDIEAVLWPNDPVPDPERARHVITRLRASLGDAGQAIVNRRGQGYILNCR